MALREWNLSPGNDKLAVVKNTTPTAVAITDTGLGGAISVRLLVDDAVATSKFETLRALEVMQQRILEDTWPPA